MFLLIGFVPEQIPHCAFPCCISRPPYHSALTLGCYSSFPPSYLTLPSVLHRYPPPKRHDLGLPNWAIQRRLPRCSAAASHSNMKSALLPLIKLPPSLIVKHPLCLAIVRHVFTFPGLRVDHESTNKCTEYLPESNCMASKPMAILPQAWLRQCQQDDDN